MYGLELYRREQHKQMLIELQIEDFFETFVLCFINSITSFEYVQYIFLPIYL